jgi:predicted DNA-binding transcriptional regulator AlpA
MSTETDHAITPDNAEEHLCLPGVEEDLNLPGVFAVLGRLGPYAWVTVPGLAKILGKDRSAVTRAIDKRQLPEPVKLLSDSGWTMRVLIAHIEQRLADAAAEAAAERERQKARDQESADAKRKLLHLSP